MAVSVEQIKQLAHQCGFELAGIAPAVPSPDFGRYQSWRSAGMAGEMAYLTDRRGDLRQDPRHLLAEVRSILCVGKLYNTPDEQATGDAWISRYAQGADYHDVMRRGLEELTSRIRAAHGTDFAHRICVDTAPLLERSYARAAGLGWIGRNTCLINQEQGSWFFLGEILLSIDLTPDTPVPDRCGTCRRCIDACPTNAIVPDGNDGWRLDAPSCISYLTIEKRGDIPKVLQGQIGNNLFGCDICQDVCPWNRRAAFTSDPEFQQRTAPAPLPDLARMTEEEFRVQFRHTPVWRAKYRGFLRNVAIALGNSESPRGLGPLEHLAHHVDPTVATAARQSLVRLADAIRVGEESK